MARRKGSSRGKSTVNSRKAALENAREKLRDDPGGTRDPRQQKQQNQELNTNNMEATTTANATTKYYNKTKLQTNSNNHQQSKTSTTTNKKTTYREAKEITNEFSTQMVETTPITTQKKLTAKQTKAAAKLAAQQQQQQQPQQQLNAKSDTNDQQQQQHQQHNEASKKIVQETEAKSNITNIPATTTNKSSTTAINANNASSTQQRNAATEANNISFDKISNNNHNHNNNNRNTTNTSNNTNNNKNDNSSNMNASDNSVNSSLSDQQQQLRVQQLENSNKSDSQHQQQQQQQQIADNSTPSMSWNNSKYLHKKFKRLASTTENDVFLQEAEKLRTTSLSSASSSVSSPPPVIIKQQQPQVQQQLQQQQQLLPTTPNTEEHLTNGTILNNHENPKAANTEHPPNNNLNNSKQNQGPQQQHDTIISPNAATTSHTNNINLATPNNNTNSICGLPALTAASSSTAGGGGRYKCPYCDLSCTKPSVLQKHIRAHTNERPYPCEICGIAFKTKSNLYKHCRSRSHAARQKGIEVSPDADDGLSDQDVDPELSNSSSEMFSRTGSPIEELNQGPISVQPMPHNQHYAFQNESQVLITSSINTSTGPSLTPTTLTACTYLQQPSQQQSQMLPLGSPAAGTLPPAAATATSVVVNNMQTATSCQKQPSIDYKPYKPKFHNASLYNTAKEAAAAAAAASSPSTESSFEMQPVALTSTTAPQKVASPIQKHTESPHMSISHQQHLTVASEQQKVTTSIHLPPPPQQSPNHLPHHPSLSPSTQMKLNNHLNTHQLQQHQMQTPAPSHRLFGKPPAPAKGLPLLLSAPVYYIGQPPGAPSAALLHPSAHMPTQPFFNTALHSMTPQQQQQFLYQLHMQQLHLQQRQLQIDHSSRVAAAAVIPKPPSPIQSPHQQTSPSIPSNTDITTLKSSSQLPNTPHMAMTSNNTRNMQQQQQHTKPSPPTTNSTIVHPIPQNPLHYMAPTANAASVALTPPHHSSSNKISSEMVEQNATLNIQRTAAPTLANNCNPNTLLQTSVNSGLQEVTLNKEKLNEHINKLISQNEAIVENKELLLQKKYPKTLNRSRSFTTNSNTGSNCSTNSSGNTQILQSTTGAPPSESPTNAKLAQAIVQKQQLQQQQQQQQQQQHQQLQQQYIYQQQQHQQQQQHLINKQRFMDKQTVEEIPATLPLNGTSKHLVGKQVVPTQQLHVNNATATVNSAAAQYQQYRTIVTITPTHPRQQPHSSPNLNLTSSTTTAHSSFTNVPLNLSAKSKLPDEVLDLNKPPPGPLSQVQPPITPRKRHSIEQPQLTPTLTINEASNSSNSNSSTPQPTTAAGKYPTNNSIIKNLLLNARGLAVPTGTGDDAVYICPLCSLECRTAEELKLHNSTYCQAINSIGNSPASSPSHKYFRSNSMSLNMPDFKILSKNPLSLAKLAWSQLKTKPSNLVLNRLSASVANTSKNSSTNTTTSTSTQPTTQSTAATSVLNISTQPKSVITSNEIPIRFVDAPLPSPGPLLGKTPLVDYSSSHESKSKSEEVIITKMHDDTMYTHGNMPEHLHSSNKRMKFEPTPKRSTASSSSATSGGDMQLLSAQELSKKEERYKRFTSSGGCMIPLSECDDVDKSPKMIRTPLLSGGSFQEVSPKKETKIPLPLMPGAVQLAPKLSLGLASSNGPQHFQFPPINQITAFNPLTLGLTEKVIPYVPGIPGPNSLQPQLPLAPLTISQQQKQQQQQQQHLLSVSPAANNKQLSRTNSPNRNKAPSPMNMITSSAQQTTNNDVVASNKPTFGGVQNVPSEFNRVPPSTNMRNIRNWTPANNSLSNPASSANNNSNKITANPINETAKSLKTFNFMRMADNLSPRKSDAKPNSTSSLTDNETRHFNLDKMSREQLIIQQPLNSTTGKSLSPTNLALTPLHVDTNVAVNANDNEISCGENKTKSKFLRPTSLPLRPGTFTPKRHHGITPTANTLPLISPETPRPSKECVQLYLNGNSYTYLGLKCSTKTFYCTLNCPQPSYVQDMHKLSMYSMWQQCAENNPHPLGLKPKEVMSLYDSRQKTLIFTMCQGKKMAYTLVAAQQTVMTPFISTRDKCYHHQLKPLTLKDTSPSKEPKTLGEMKSDGGKDTSTLSSSNPNTVSQTLEGGYESHENYIYVRGRGRGKYVCSECGIRCKKPSMLKKHIRTHTDVRPYTCKHCNFSFKTKGNLTKHMQSKTHYKKCIELGLNPGPMPAEGDFLEPDVEFDQQSSTSAGGRTSSMGNGESDSDNDSSDNETESSNESDSNRSNATQRLIASSSAAEDNKSHLEHEAARCLLTLSMTPPIHTQTMETSMASTPQVAVTAACSATPTPPIRRVISYTSPKPPFDYQKQEQYYSNPKEPKPKINNSSATNFETAPMDLTKPRALEVQPAQLVTQNCTSFSSNPGPVQTQAQIRDVIFGVNKNESGFLKTMISVSSKVGRNFADNYEEHHHKLNEDMMLYDYRREQTLQYYKIKQTQLSRGMSVNPNVNMSSATPTTSTTVTTMAALGLTTATNTTSSGYVATVATAATKEEQQPSSENDKQLPKMEIVEPQECYKTETAATLVAPAAVSINTNTNVPTTATSVTTVATIETTKSLKSSDESEETDDEPPAKKVALQNDEKPAHNANLPAAVLQPGTTDFSGVLSGGAGSSNSSQPTRTVIVGEDGFTTNNNEILPVHPRVPQISNADGRPVCSICSKTFQKQSQLVLHMNIHYMERKYKCDPCSVSFRTQGHLQKHERSEAHKNKVIMTSTFGVPTTSNPRPFECTDCKIAFRIHGHLAKHLRSKTHVQKLECLQKLPFGTYAEIERAGISLTEIDTSDCENSLISLRVLAQKLIEKDPSSKLGSYTTPSGDNSNTGLVSQDSASEDGFTAAERAAATAIASLDNNSAANTPQRANSTSEDESINMALNSNLKRRLPGTFSNGEESDKEFQDQEKRLRSDAVQMNNISQLNTASPTN